MKNKIKKLIGKEFYYLGTLVTISAVTSLYAISRNSFGLDEGYTILVSQNFSELLNVLWNKEANMWLYFLILHFWLYIGNNEVIVRSLSAIFAILSVFLVYKIGHIYKDRSVGFVAGLLLSVNMLFVSYAQFARSYSLMLFITALASYFYLKVGEGNKGRLPYILISALSFFVHFFAVFTLFSQFLTAVISGRIKKLFLPIVLAGLFIIPILLSPSLKSGQVDWISKPNLINLLGTGFVLTGDFPPLFAIYSVLFLCMLPELTRRFREFKYNYLLSLLIVPIVSCFALSLVAKPIFQSTYFIASLIPLTIVGSLSLHLIHKNIIRYVVISLILAFSFIRLGLWYQGNTQYKWVITNRTDDFRSAEKFVIDHAYPDDTAVFYGYFARAPFEIYSKENIQITELTKAPYAGGGGAELPDPDNKIIDSLAKKHVWLITNRNRGDLFNRASQFSKLEKQLLKTHTLGLKKQFFGVGVEELIIK